MRVVFGRSIWVAIALALTTSAALADRIALSGEVTYRERIALPEGGSLRISLVDLATPTEPRVAAQAAIASPGQVPLSFNLNFEDSIITEGHAYGLVAEIVADGAVWFRNTEPHAIDAAALGTPITVLVNFAGKVVDPKAPPPLAINPDLLDVTWRAEEIDGVPVAANVETSLSIAGDMRAGGRGGCNNYFAQARISGEALRFSAVAATRLSCAGPVTTQETAFFETLAATRFWRLGEDGALYLVDAGGRDLARFSKSFR